MQETGEEDQELLQEGQGLIGNLKQDLEAWQLQRLLSGPYDDHNAVITIQAMPSHQLIVGKAAHSEIYRFTEQNKLLPVADEVTHAKA